MTREKANEICEMIETHGIEVIKAYGEGKVIQHLNLDGEWVDCDMPISFSSNHSYRIKPEEVELQIQVGRMNGKGQRCLEALINLGTIKLASTETLLKELKNRRVISSWYYNGSYHIGNELS